MVWQYTEYAQCPYITDWVDKKFKFAICLDEDTTKINPITIETPSGSINSLEFKTNDILRPRFYMRIGENKSSLLNLELDLLKGLVKRIWSEGKETLKINKLPGEYYELKTQKIDTEKFEDLKIIGEYAVKRFPKIAEDITSNLKFNEDIPDDEIEIIKEYSEKKDEIPSWKTTQKELSRDFYNIFIIYTIYETKNKKIIQRKNSFTKKQLQELHSLVEPLK